MSENDFRMLHIEGPDDIIAALAAMPERDTKTIDMFEEQRS